MYMIKALHVIIILINYMYIMAVCIAVKFVLIFNYVIWFSMKILTGITVSQSRTGPSWLEICRLQNLDNDHSLKGHSRENIPLERTQTLGNKYLNVCNAPHQRIPL